MRLDPWRRPWALGLGATPNPLLSAGEGGLPSWEQAPDGLPPVRAAALTVRASRPGGGGCVVHGPGSGHLPPSTRGSPFEPLGPRGARRRGSGDATDIRAQTARRSPQVQGLPAHAGAREASRRPRRVRPRARGRRSSVAVGRPQALGSDRAGLEGPRRLGTSRRTRETSSPASSLGAMPPPSVGPPGAWTPMGAPTPRRKAPGGERAAPPPPGLHGRTPRDGGEGGPRKDGSDTTSRTAPLGGRGPSAREERRVTGGRTPPTGTPSLETKGAQPDRSIPAAPLRRPKPWARARPPSPEARAVAAMNHGLGAPEGTELGPLDAPVAPPVGAREGPEGEGRGAGGRRPSQGGDGDAWVRH